MFFYICQKCQQKIVLKNKKRKSSLCRKCSNYDNHSVKNKRKETTLKKYGVTNISQVQSIQTKKQNTLLKNYGVINPLLSDKIKTKVEKTNLKKYGEKYSFQSDVVKNKIKNTLQEKYGITNIMELDSIKSKIKETNLQKYGFDNPSKNPDVKEKIKNTNIKKYGLKEGKKGKNVLEKSGFSNYQTLTKELINFLENNPYSVSCEETYNKFKLSDTFLAKLLRKANREDLINGDIFVSKGEIQLQDFIKRLHNGEIITNDRKILDGKELDIYLPELKIAIEYNGLIFHSEKFKKDKNYHFDKFNTCQKLGISLYSIFDYEWKEFREKYELFFKNLILGKQRIYARDCVVTKDEKLIKDFIEKYHIQGVNLNSTYYLGLMYKDEIVLGCSFGKHHRGKKENILNRVCFKDKNVVGGLKKILHHSPFVVIYTWSDNRISPSGSMYKMNDFKKVASLPPDYFYTDGTRIFSKQSQKKSLTHCPKNMTEKEWCLKRNLYRVWDCGKIKWKYEK